MNTPRRAKMLYFVAGLPRSGSTLLMNLLGQNPRFHVTPTSGLMGVLQQVREHWPRNVVFRDALSEADSEALKLQIMRGVAQSYFDHVEEPVCVDKNRYWAESMEMAAAVVGGPARLRVLVPVRDLRDVVASFEKLHRKTAALGRVPQDRMQNNRIKFRTAIGRLQVFVADNEVIGRPYRAIRDAVTRGWLPRMKFVEYGALTHRPADTLREIYEFLGEMPYEGHDFDNVEQITFEDDFIHGFKDLHKIRTKVEPQPPAWPDVFDGPVLQSPVWRHIEVLSRFWRTYMKDATPGPGGGPAGAGGPAALETMQATGPAGPDTESTGSQE